MENLNFSLEKANALNKGTLMGHLNIEYTELHKGKVVAKMPVNETTLQPDGIVHGGANLALAETVAGLGSALIVDLKKTAVRGAQVSANHVGSTGKGTVIATATIIHEGAYTHVWNVNIKDKNDKLLSTCRITNVIVKRL